MPPIVAETRKPAAAVVAPARRAVMQGLRLLMVADTSSTHTQRWAAWAREAGAQPTVLSLAPDPVPGVEVVHFPGPRRWYHRIPKARVLLDYLPFRKLIQRVDPQLVHFHFVSEGGRHWYWNALDVPMVASSWGQDVIFDNGPWPGAERSLRIMFERCQLVTATTHQLAGATAQYTPPGKPIHVIPIGVDLKRFRFRDDAASDVVTLGFVKHLLPKYGPDVMIEAFARIHEARPKTRLILAGRGTMRQQIEKRVAELGLGQAVEIPGRIEYQAVPELMRSLDLMVMPSVYESETFGVAAIEASACGVPVVASRVGGVPEAVLHGKTGLLVPPRDASALADACIKLIDDPQRRREMGLTGRRFVERYYDWKHNTAQMEEIYRAALEGEPPAAIPVFRPGMTPEFPL